MPRTRCTSKSTSREVFRYAKGSTTAPGSKRLRWPKWSRAGQRLFSMGRTAHACSICVTLSWLYVMCDSQVEAPVPMDED